LNSKKTPRKEAKTTRKPSATHKAARRRPKKSEDTDTTATPEATVVPEARVETPAAPPRSGSRRGRRGRGGRSKPGAEPRATARSQAPDDGTPAVAEAAGPPAGVRSRQRLREPVSKEAQVEEVNGAVVIRFPPVAPPPFVLPTTPAAPAAAAPPPPPPPPPPQVAPPRVTPAASVAPVAPVAPAERPAAPVSRPPVAREPDRPRGRDHGRRDHAAPPAEKSRFQEAERTPAPPAAVLPVAPAAPVIERAPTPPARPALTAAPPALGDAPTTLTRSQKRRLRRKQRRSRQGPTPADATPNGDDLADVAEEPAPHAAPMSEAPNGGQAGVLEDEGDDLEEDVAPWLEDADVVRADLNDIDRSQPEVIAPPGEEDATELEEVGEAGEAVETPEGPRERRPEGEPRERGGRRRGRRGRRSNRRDEIEAGPQGMTEVTPRTSAPSPAPSGHREMIINTMQREECRIAVLENGRLEEIYIERAAVENHVGNIYKGVVTNVEPSIQAAFVDFGQGKNGFLHISDLHPQYFPDGAGQFENVGRKMPRRSRPPIQRCLRRGQEVLVQVTKEGIGTKGPTLSTYLSIPGRFLVMMPGMRRLGVSRRIEDEGSRDKLRDVLAGLELPDGMGFIARTAAMDRSQSELQNDLSYLTRLWRSVERRIQNDAAPAELYRESDLLIRTIRDVFTNDIERIVVDDAEVLERARDFLSIFSPRSQDIVTPYTDAVPVFHRYGIEAELERLHSRHVPLKSGGSLVIDQTEALVAIDVNSGRFRAEDDAETTAYKINQEAADEISRQLRLRDLGGVIVCDFIDMRIEAHRREIERRLIENLKKHKERAKVLRTSAFGLIELTRQRQRASLTRSAYRDCRHCRGTGLVKTVESVVLDVMRLLQLAVTREHIRAVEIAVAAEVGYLLQNRKRALICELETKHRRVISVRSDVNFTSDQVEITCTDARGRIVPHT
jgi:Rne/Rng family ribonuclease